MEKNGFELTTTEATILRELMLGLSNKKIAQKIYLSPHTVKFHLQKLYYKTNTHTRTELCMRILYLMFGQELSAELLMQYFGKK